MSVQAWSQRPTSTSACLVHILWKVRYITLLYLDIQDPCLISNMVGTATQGISEFILLGHIGVMIHLLGLVLNLHFCSDGKLSVTVPSPSDNQLV